MKRSSTFKEKARCGTQTLKPTLVRRKAIRLCPVTRARVWAGRGRQTRLVCLSDVLGEWIGGRERSPAHPKNKTD